MKRIVFRVLFLCSIVLLLFSIVRSLVGSSQFVGFSSFLEFIQNTEPLIPNTQILNISLGSDWGIFDFLRQFLQGCVSIVNLFGYLCIQAVNFTSLVFRFVRYLFVV